MHNEQRGGGDFFRAPPWRVINGCGAAALGLYSSQNGNRLTSSIVVHNNITLLSINKYITSLSVQLNIYFISREQKCTYLLF